MTLKYWTASLNEKEPLCAFLLCFLLLLLFQIEFIWDLLLASSWELLSQYLKTGELSTQEHFQHLLFTADILWFHNFISLKAPVDQVSHCGLLENYGICTLWVGLRGLVFSTFPLQRKTCIESSNISLYYNHQGI